jgi:2TM domain
MMTAEEYRQAEFGYTLAESRRGFKIHAAVNAIVMTGLVVLNALLWAYGDSDFPWAVFPLVGWGIGLTFYYIYGCRQPPQGAGGHSSLRPCSRLGSSARRRTERGGAAVLVAVPVSLTGLEEPPERSLTPRPAARRNLR